MTIDLKNRIPFRLQGTRKRASIGLHLIVDLSACQRDVLSDIEQLRAILHGAAERFGATVLHEKFHRFTPGDNGSAMVGDGATGYLLLSESHISIHTWPEYDYAAVDIFTCGKLRPDAAVDYLRERLGAEHAEVRLLRRRMTGTLLGTLDEAPASSYAKQAFWLGACARFERL